MDPRQSELRTLLQRHHPTDEKERLDRHRMLAFAEALRTPFSRHQEPAHFTASAAVIDPRGARVCLIHHAKFDRWLQPGGHVEDLDPSVSAAAVREAREETGLEVSLHGPDLLDVDIHSIPARKEEPAHEHLDLRFLLIAKLPEDARHDPAESLGIAWLTWAAAKAASAEPAFLRMLLKAQQILNP